MSLVRPSKSMKAVTSDARKGRLANRLANSATGTGSRTTFVGSPRGRPRTSPAYRCNLPTSATQEALAAKAATANIPLVFGSGGDPVALGLVARLSRSGGNITGISFMNVELSEKRLGLPFKFAPKFFKTASSDVESGLGGHSEYLYSKMRLQQRINNLFDSYNDRLWVAVG